MRVPFIMKNHKSSYKNGKVKVYTIKDKDGEVLFSGTAKEAVRKGISIDEASFRSKVYKIREGIYTSQGLTVEITEKDSEKIKIKNADTEYNTPICLLYDGCPNFSSKIKFPPCCKHCKYYETCEDVCLNNPNICGLYCKEGSAKYIEAYNEVIGNVYQSSLQIDMRSK